MKQFGTMTVTKLVIAILMLLPISFGFTTPSPSTKGAVELFGSEAKVVSKPAPPKGDGVFADEKIGKGVFVTEYKGRLLTLEEELEEYPDKYPDYCLSLSPNLSIDGMNSNHWSRLINHNEHGNLICIRNPTEGKAHFVAARDIECGEELCFDYGVAYFIFRNIIPAPETESRSLELPKESAEEAAQAQASSSHIMQTPTTPDEIQKFLTDSKEEDTNSKRATLMRGLDFYSSVVWTDDEDTVEIPTDLKGNRESLSYSDISLEFLVERLERLWQESQKKQN